MSLNAFFDYFAFTVKLNDGGSMDEAVASLRRVLRSQLEDEGKDARGLYFYSYSVRFEGALLCWGGEYQKDTILVSITGEGCRHFDADTLRGLIVSMSYYGDIRAKRFDLAIDIEGFDTYYRVKQDIELLFISNRVKTLSHYETKDLSTGEITGGTLYFGSRTSPRMTRLYMKERRDGAKVTRIEIEAKEGWASQVLNYFMLSNDVSVIMLALCRDYINIENFVVVNGTREIEITYPKKERQQDLALWLVRGVSGSLAMACKVYGREFILSLLSMGWGKKKLPGVPPLHETPVSNTGVQISDAELQELNDLLFSAELETWADVCPTI